MSATYRPTTRKKPPRSRPSGASSSVRRGGSLVELRQRFEYARLLAGVEPGEELHDPPFVRSRHLAERPPAGSGQLDRVGATVVARRLSDDEPRRHEFVRDAGDVAAGDHHAFGDLSHLQPHGMALQLGEKVEARQGRGEIGAQVLAHAPLDEVGARQKAQPQTERLMVVAARPRFVVEDLRALHPASSPPSMVIA